MELARACGMGRQESPALKSLALHPWPLPPRIRRLAALQSLPRKISPRLLSARLRQSAALKSLPRKVSPRLLSARLRRSAAL